MMQKMIHRLLKHRHFWREATFSEISELYAAKLLRTLALNLAAIFVLVYLYQIGYSLVFIAAYLAIYTFAKALLSLPMAMVVARIGSKHAMLIGNVFYIPPMILFVFLPQVGTWLLLVISAFQTVSATLYDIGYAVDFSKVKNVHHTGKELGFVNIFEKFATGISPLVGGTVAFLAGPKAIMILAGILFALAAIPLFRTAEQESPRQRLRWGGFPWRVAWRSLRAQIAVGYDDLSSGGPWSLFIVLTIILTVSNEMYAQLGSFTSVTFLTAFAASYTYGKLIDRKKGGALLKLATIGNSLVHLSRPFISGWPSVVMTNMANEGATTGYKMAFTKGAFDLADSSGNRILYIGLLQLASNLGAVLASSVLVVCLLTLGDINGLKAFFFSAAAVVLLVMTARFPLYRK